MNQSEREKIGLEIDKLSIEADRLSRRLERIACQFGIKAPERETALEIVARRVVALMYEERGEWGELKAAVAEMGALLDAMK